MIQSQIESYIKPILQDMGYELWGCQFLARGHGSLLRIYIDKSDGISVEDCERASLRISSILDVEDPIAGNYSLEISSPGIPRPLFYTEQYLQYINCEIEIKLVKPEAGKKKYRGFIKSVDAENLILKCEEQEYNFIFSNIAKAHLVPKGL